MTERVMIIGSVAFAKAAISEFPLHLDDVSVICIIDEDGKNKGKYCNGIPIVGNHMLIRKMILKYDITSIVYAFNQNNREWEKRIFEICKDTGCAIYKLKLVKII